MTNSEQDYLELCEWLGIEPWKPKEQETDKDD